MKTTISFSLALLFLIPLPCWSVDTDQFDFSQLENIAVQDHGIEKTFLSFATERSQMITGRSKFEGHHPIALVLSMTFDQGSWTSKRLFKVTHPDLVKLLNLKEKKAKRISLEEFFDPKYRTELMKYWKSSQSVGRAVQAVNHSVLIFQELQNDLSIIPKSDEDWLSPVSKEISSDNEKKVAASWADLRIAFLAGDQSAFNKAAENLAKANEELATICNVSSMRLKVDKLYTKTRPFRWSYIIYLFAFFASLMVIVFKRPGFWKVSIGLLILGLTIHTSGLIMRTILAGRAPVSNLYESFVFAIAGVILISIIFDIVYKNRLGGFCGALLGFVFLVIANNMSAASSQVRPLMPALQSSWLTYHVITIMLSYSAFAISFVVSIIYVIMYFRKKSTGELDLKNLDFFNYRIIAIGFPLLTIGIITGAVWAATAWGRPWAFDPKETWSAITWLIYGIYLHVRFLPQGRGLWSAILSIVGFSAVIFTYLGVNFLLSGLHSYAG